MEKEKCDCGQLGVWCYTPGYSDGSNDCFCDNCVPRGCSCMQSPKDGNYENTEPENWVDDLDEWGRQMPCCEFWYEKEGWDKE